MHDTLAIIFLIVMSIGAFVYRNKTVHEEPPKVRVQRRPPPIEEHERKLGVRGDVLTTLYDLVEVGAEINVEPASFEVPTFGLVKHILTQLCLRASDDTREFYHTTTNYAGTRVYDDGTKIHDICAMIHEKSSLTTVRIRFMCLCDNEDDGVTFLCMKFDPLDASPGHMLYSREGDCAPCHKDVNDPHYDWTEWFESES